MKKNDSGLTLIELLTVIAILGILATSLVVVLKPGTQFAKARDMERETDLIVIVSAIYQYSSEHSGELPDTDGDPATSDFPTSLTCIGTDLGCFDLTGAGETGETIVPEYLAEIPKDPKPQNAGEGNNGNTGYEIMVDTNGRLVASASGERKTISVTR